MESIPCRGNSEEMKLRQSGLLYVELIGKNEGEIVQKARVSKVLYIILRILDFMP